MPLGALVQINLGQNFLSVENVETSAVTILTVENVETSAVKIAVETMGFVAALWLP